jgi:hypothetical protein
MVYVRYPISQQPDVTKATLQRSSAIDVNRNDYDYDLGSNKSGRGIEYDRHLNTF